MARPGDWSSQGRHGASASEESAPAPVFFFNSTRTLGSSAQVFRALQRCLHPEHPSTERTMGAVKRKADQGSTPSKKDKAASTDRTAKRRKSDVAEPSPVKSKPEASAPKSVFRDEETSFPRGGASVLTPLEHKQIQIKATQDVLFEQAGGAKRTSGEDGFSDMGSDNGEAAPKASKKRPSKKSKKSHEHGDSEKTVRAVGLSYKVRLRQVSALQVEG